MKRICKVLCIIRMFFLIRKDPLMLAVRTNSHLLLVTFGPLKPKAIFPHRRRNSLAPLFLLHLPSPPALTLPSHVSLNALPPWDLIKRAFPIVFNQPQPGHVTWNPADFTVVSAFKKACTLYGPTSPCLEFLRNWADHWLPADFAAVSKMVLTPQQLLQWQMWVNDEAKEILRNNKSCKSCSTYFWHFNRNWHCGWGRGSITEYCPTHGILDKEVALRAWAKVDSALSDGSFVKIFQGPREEYAQFLGKLKDAIEKSIKDAKLQHMLLK